MRYCIGVFHVGFTALHLNDRQSWEPGCCPAKLTCEGSGMECCCCRQHRRSAGKVLACASVPAQARAICLLRPHLHAHACAKSTTRHPTC